MKKSKKAEKPLKEIVEKSFIPAAISDLQAIENIVLDLENEAESANYHDICVLYRNMAEILLDELDTSVALKIMKAIQKHNGFLP